MLIISIVIPVLNERITIEDFIARLKQIINIEANIEIIFVDGGSEDGTVEYLKQFNYTVIQTQKGRGNQLHQGALASQGDYLLFLHADSYFIAEPWETIRQISDEYSIGAFTLQFEPSNWILNQIAWGSNWRIQHRNIAFGDQGMFMQRDFYFQLGGFQNFVLMEDYAFSLQVKQAGYQIIRSNAVIKTSSRYFYEKGFIRSLIKMQYCQFLYRRGVSIDRIVEIYHR